MSTLKIWALCAALSFAPAAMAQPPAQVPPGPAQGQDGNAQDSNRAAIASIVVAEIDSLPQAVRKEVDTQISRTSDGELDTLRHTLSAIPAVSVALDAKGKRVSDVVAATFSEDGALLLVTTTEV